ncbi:MAG: hypothetical protein ACREF4_08180 [Gammaproteobacteria bacterium]
MRKRGRSNQILSLIYASTIMLALSAGTVAGQPHTERKDLSGHDFPAVPPEQLADVIIVLKPNVTFPLHLPTPTDQVVYGDIVRIEKGVAPHTIVHTRNTFITPLQAGVPRKLFLKAFPDGSGYYIIGNFPDSYGGPRP